MAAFRQASLPSIPRTQQNRTFGSSSARAQQKPEEEKPEEEKPEEEKYTIADSIRGAARKLVSSTTAPYAVHGATERMYKACASQAHYTMSQEDRRNGTLAKTEDGEEIGKGTTLWHTEFKLPPTFSTWSQVTMLHLYLAATRFRNLDPDAARAWTQQLVDHFFFDAEERMDMMHELTSRTLRHKYLKDLFVQWRGIIVAYDEGLVKGDAVLAAAVWRNVYKGRPDVDARALAAIVCWMRRTLRALDRVLDEALLFHAAGLVKSPSKEDFASVDEPVPELRGVLSQTAAGASTSG